MQIAPTMNRIRRQRVKVELEVVAMAITRSSFATRRVSPWVFGIGGTGWFWSIEPTLLDGEECVNSSRMLKKSASFVLASLRSSTYRSVRLRLFARCDRAGGHFEHPVWCTLGIPSVLKNETSACLESFPQAPRPL